ncbi:RNA-directed DNA polymerase [Tanacetum coccineum]
MYTRGRKKAEAEPTPPARDPRDVETIERLQQRIQELELQQLQPDSPAEEAETKPNFWDDEPVDVNPFGGRSIGKLKVKLVVIKLRQYALLWWDHVNKRRRIKGKSKNMTVEEVINEFDKLRMRCDVVEEEEQVVARFLGVLKPEIADIIKAKSKGSTSRFTPPTRTAPPTTPKQHLKPPPTTSAAGNTRERVNNVPRCYKCGGLGHYARDRPNLKTLAFVPDDAGPIYDTDAEPEVDEPGDELVYPDHKEALAIQRVLNVAVSKSVDDNSWLRNNTFRTKCTSKGKIYDMIIDGDSCENVVSKYMVEKLGIKMEDHPEPYQKTKHDGFQNTYSFKKDGVNITLVPFDSQAEGSNLFMKKTGFEGLMKTSPCMFTIVVVKENEIISEAPLQVQPLLKEFADMILDDIPPGLPAMRDIQHCIDLIPGFAIPNRPAYRMNPKEFVELQRQVTELLEKGLIRESMSPCAVHALLVPKHRGTFWMCIDSRAVNKITIKYHFPIPRLDDLLDQLHGSTIVSKIDLRSGYHQIRMRSGDEWKTAFKTRDGLYEWMVMPFGLSNVPSTFMRLMNQVECDAFGVGIGGVLSQNQRPIAFFSEKLNGARRKYSTYDKEFYAIVRSLDTWRHYLLSNKFVLFSDHEALKFINGQHKLKPRHAKWVEFIQAFSFVIRQKVGSDNQVADALSRRHSLITTMQIRVQGFDSFGGLYCDFREIRSKFDNGQFQRFFKLDGYLFKGARLLERCRTCHIAKTHSRNAGLHTPLSVPVAPWEDVSLDFVIGLPRTQRAKDFEIVKLHGVPKTLTSDRDVKFTEVVNRSLGNLLRSLIGDNAKQWDLILSQPEFAYNWSVNRTIGKSPFEVVYGWNLITPLDLVHVPDVWWFSEEETDQSEQIKELLRSVQEHIIRHNKQYKEHVDKRRKQVLYREGDLVWIHLRKERFSAGRFGKLKPRGDGPFRVLKKINDNAYKIELPSHYNVSATFSVADLSPYKGDSDDEPNSWSSLFQEGEDDADAVNERVNVTNTFGAYFAAINFCGGLG